MEMKVRMRGIYQDLALLGVQEKWQTRYDSPFVKLSNSVYRFRDVCLRVHNLPLKANLDFIYYSVQQSEKEASAIKKVWSCFHPYE